MNSGSELKRQETPGRIILSAGHEVHAVPSPVAVVDAEVGALPAGAQENQVQAFIWLRPLEKMRKYFQ